VETIAFFLLAVAAIGSAIVVVTHRNPLVSAVALAFNLVTIAGFFLLVQAQFLALLQVIVYAGAIMVLIIFVIMLLNVREELKTRPVGTFQKWLAPLFALAFAVILGRAILAGVPASFAATPEGYGTVSQVGRELFARFYYPFEVISLLLVAAMVGSVVLAKRRL
jgi:NADH-quinone oxidoreductase subunit J